MKFETGTKSILLQPFSPIVIAANDNERIRIWNYEETTTTMLNSFDNHDFPEKGIVKLCLINEFDDSLLLAASCDGNIQIWKDYNVRNKQKLVIAFSSIQGHKPGVQSLNAVVDWQQLSGYLISSIMLWDLEKEHLVNSIPSSSDCSISALAASHVHRDQFAAGFVDGSVRLYDVRTPDMLVCATWPHTQKVVGIGFQPRLDPAKIISASQAGNIQFLDTRSHRDAYLTINAHRGSLTALAVHRHAPVIASGSAKQLIKVFSLEGEQLGTIRYYPSFMPQKIGSVSCLIFHPYQILLAAGTADAYVSIYADENVGEAQDLRPRLGKADALVHVRDASANSVFQGHSVHILVDKPHVEVQPSDQEEAKLVNSSGVEIEQAEVAANPRSNCSCSEDTLHYRPALSKARRYTPKDFSSFCPGCPGHPGIDQRRTPNRAGRVQRGILFCSPYCWMAHNFQNLGQGLQLREDVHYFSDGSDEAAQLAYMIEDRLNDTAEEVDKERALKEVTEATVKDKDKVVENAEEWTREYPNFLPSNLAVGEAQDLRPRLGKADALVPVRDTSANSVFQGHSVHILVDKPHVEVQPSDQEEAKLVNSSSVEIEQAEGEMVVRRNMIVDRFLLGGCLVQ
nr:regulatory-associated protein of tor 1 [Quercus suber]